MAETNCVIIIYILKKKFGSYLLFLVNILEMVLSYLHPYYNDPICINQVHWEQNKFIYNMFILVYSKGRWPPIKRKYYF